MDVQEIRVIAEKLVRYYEQVAAAYPTVDMWQFELDIAKRWLALMNQPTVDLADVDALLEIIDSRDDAGGTGWVEVGLMAHAWRNKLEKINL